MIRYYYTQLFSLSVLGGATFYKPLFFEYPDDINAFNTLKYNVMLGDSLKLSILSDKTGQNQTDFYFPAGTWCNAFNSSERCFDSAGKNYTMRSKA
jgi:alpha-glucosidase (family GH31 glycosyl hydrolase)